MKFDELILNKVSISKINKIPKKPIEIDIILEPWVKSTIIVPQDYLGTVINLCIEKYQLPAKMLKFGRTVKAIDRMGLDLGKIELIDLMGYNDYMEAQYHSKFMISDSGTSHEEPALLNTPVVVPRLYTERPQSIENYCSVLLNTEEEDLSWEHSHLYLEKYWNGSIKPNLRWLGDGKTAERIVSILASLET